VYYKYTFQKLQTVKHYYKKYKKKYEWKNVKYLTTKTWTKTPDKGEKKG
jgi:hypothetical protein